MTDLALALVLTSAIFHATWNLLSKRAGGGLPFLWLFSLLMTIFYTPLAIASIILAENTVTPLWPVFILGTGFLHIAYFSMLTKGYQTGDLSLIYPLARGTGPMLATVAAVLLLDERPTPLAIFGVVSIGVGVFIFMDGFSKLRDTQSRQAMGYAFIVGMIIATYTIWDKYAVGVLLIPPIFYEWSGDLIRTILLRQGVRGRWDEVWREWNEHRWEAIGVALLSPLAYILVLTALTFSPVSYIAPLREVSILIGAAMGTMLLGEGEMRRRWSAASAIVVGVMALAIG